jgi:diguanylate cyclase
MPTLGVSSAPLAAQPGRPTAASPRPLRVVWVLLIALVAVEAAHELFGLVGPETLYETWIHDSVVVASAALCLARAAREPRERAAWLAFGVGLASWSAGTVLWNVLYLGAAHPPYPSVADILWLLWYPFTALGIALLIRMQVSGFELHRWMDGLAATLLVLAATFPITLPPVEHYLNTSRLAGIVDVSYPVLDTLLLGAILGVFGLMAWRPGKVWLLLGFGCLIMAVADAAFAVQQARGVATENSYDFVWASGALLIAYAAWLPAQRPSDRELIGWQAIALPLAAQLFAVGLQACIVLFPAFDTQTHRIVVLAVLIIATVQLVLARPRLKRSDDGRRSSASPSGPDGWQRSQR